MQKVKIKKKNCTRVASFMEGLDLLFTENLLEAGKTSQANTVTQKIEEFEHKLEEQTKAISTVKQRTGSISPSFWPDLPSCWSDRHRPCSASK